MARGFFFFALLRSESRFLQISHTVQFLVSIFKNGNASMVGSFLEVGQCQALYLRYGSCSHVLTNVFVIFFMSLAEYLKY